MPDSKLHSTETLRPGGNTLGFEAVADAMKDEFGVASTFTPDKGQHLATSLGYKQKSS